MHWRVLASGPAWQKVKGAPNRRRFRDRVRSGRATGVLAFAGDRPVGWCAVGPYRDFPRLARARTLTRPARPEGGRATWSIVCFVVARDWRRAGVAGRLVEGAVAHAFAAGAEEIEAYPVLPRRPDLIPDVFAFTGLPSLFERAGFERMDPDPARRSIYLLSRAGS
jgi:GNAT superfamily N-acetyltransferase